MAMPRGGDMINPIQPRLFVLFNKKKLISKAIGVLGVGDRT